MLVDEKTALIRKLGKRRLTLTLQQPLPALPAALAGWPLELEDNGRQLVLHVSTRRPRIPAFPPFCAALARSEIDFKDLDTTTSTLEDIFVDFVGRARAMNDLSGLNLGGVWAIYRYEMARDGPHHLAERRDAGDHHFALFRGVRSRDRLAHERSRRGQLRRLHRARAHHALAAHAKHLQRIYRDLFSQIHRNDFRAALRADILRGGRCVAYVGAAATKSVASGSSSLRPRRCSCRCGSIIPYG